MQTNILKTLAAILLSVLITGCCNQNSGTEKNDQQTATEAAVNQNETVILDDSLKRTLIEKGTEVAGRTTSALQKALKGAIQEGGLEYAIKFCNLEALEITDSISEMETVAIKRVAEKHRNPLNKMDEAENELFTSYISQLQNEQPLHPVIIANNEGHPVFYQPIYTGALCLNCHGKLDTNISPALAGTIQKLYPDDQATGFKEGQLRGMWAITFTEMKVN
ncbi:MAG: DUF3365 domain-containing protein [Bacteroidales bacterium]|jgi:hypothetical protein|nr:DUF3365 domain-containing protein [Bacteroidales bacterium]